MNKEIQYRYTGPRDSKTEGWNIPNANQVPHPGRVEVETYMGTIIAEVTADTQHPGIWLSFRRHGDDYEKTVALLEDTRHEGVSLRVWGGDHEDGDDYNWREFFEVPAEGKDEEIYGEDE